LPPSAEFVFWVAFLVWALLRFLVASSPVAIRLGKVGLGGVFVPLTEKVIFKTRLQRGGRVQVNKYVRWRYKLEPSQYLSVWINVPAIWNSSEGFLCRMTKDGRIVIPKLTMVCLQKGKSNLDGYLVEVTLKPF
jgi:hypothetical protein